MTLPFDRVVVNDDSGAEHERMSAVEFMNLPLDVRVRFILGRHVTFWRGETEVERRHALAALRLQGAGRTNER